MPLRHQNHAVEPSKTWADRNGSLQARTGRHAQHMNSWRPGYECRQLSFDAAAVHRISNCHRTVKPISKDENDPDGTRTRVAGVKGRSPRPLDDGASDLWDFVVPPVGTGQVGFPTATIKERMGAL